MQVIQTGPPVVGLSMGGTIPGEQLGFVAVDIPVRIEPPPKHLPRLALACSVGPTDMGQPVFELSKTVYNRLPFRVPQEHCSEGSSLTLSAEGEGTVLWQKCYRVSWKESLPLLEELP
jgi:hypothetical protein